VTSQLRLIIIIIMIIIIKPKYDKHKQDTQCKYNVISRLVRITIVAVEKQKVLLILSVCL